MAVETYAPSSTKILHWTAVDFVSRPSSFPPIHLVQYDKKLPIVAVNLYNNGERYSIPSNASANVLVEKQDGTFVSNPVLGCNTDRTVVYFEATYQMLYYSGTIHPVIELKISDSETGSSSAITIIVDRNPVQEKAKESSNEYKSTEQFMNTALEAKNQALSSAQSANQSASKAAVSERNAKDYLMSIEMMPVFGPAIIQDSNNENLMDSGGNEVFGIYQFVTAVELQNMNDEIIVLSNRNHALEDRIKRLEVNAILDSDF